MIGDVQGLLDLDELADGLLATLRRNFPSDFVSINDIGPDRDRVIAVISPPQPEELHRAFGEYAFQNPLMARHTETLDGRAYRFSDVITVDEYHRLDLYQHLYKPMGSRPGATRSSTPHCATRSRRGRRARGCPRASRPMPSPTTA